VAAAGERPAAAEAKPARDPLDPPGRCERGRQRDAGVFAPDILLSLRRKQAQMPVMDADNAEDPAARAADGGDFDDRLIEGFGIELVAAVALRLDAAKQPRLLEVVERLLRQPPQLFCMGSALAQYRKQCTDTVE